MQYMDETRYSAHLQLFKHLNFALYAGGSISIVSKPINKCLNMFTMLLLCFPFSLLVFQFFIFSFLKLFIVSSLKKSKRKERLINKIETSHTTGNYTQIKNEQTIPVCL